MTVRELGELRRSLVRDADLFDDPSAYRAGVDDVIEAVRQQPAIFGDTAAPVASEVTEAPSNHIGWFG